MFFNLECIYKKLKKYFNDGPALVKLTQKISLIFIEM